MKLCNQQNRQVDCPLDIHVFIHQISIYYPISRWPLHAQQHRALQEVIIARQYFRSDLQQPAGNAQAVSSVLQITSDLRQREYASLPRCLGILHLAELWLAKHLPLTAHSRLRHVPTQIHNAVSIACQIIPSAVACSLSGFAFAAGQAPLFAHQEV